MEYGPDSRAAEKREFLKEEEKESKKTEISFSAIMEEISPSTSSNSPPRMTYDVFISFRGEVRNTFVGFLYESLRQFGIMTFMDDKKLQIGDELNENLVKAIQESRSSIVVLSKDYASSKWCLKELAMIIDSMSGTTHRVLPVFYHVDPSDVRHQSGSFKKSFDEYQVVPQNFKDEEKEKYLKEVQHWRVSMTNIGLLSGLKVTKDSPEIDIVKKITNQIFNTWRPMLVTSDKNLVGMTSPLLQMNVQLGLGLDDVRFVGLVGMGGIGKTTIAKVVHDCIAPKFECSCFLRISRGGSMKSKLVSLQDQMLSRLVLKEDVRIWDEDYGAEMIKKQLSGRKVLLVLDGIEEKRQLKMLAGNPEWFGPGSRVIITTRNRQVLQQTFKMFEYDVELLDGGNALRLFHNHAFGLDYNGSTFMDLSKEIVEKVGRLPLALKVIGSYLNKKDGVIWKETLNRLIKIDEKELFDILKVSYDGLGAESQKVFLDLACFFHGRRKDLVTKLLESFGYSPHSEIQLLIERCLIEVSNWKILMHDSIVAMGQEIVRKESLTQLGRQSRIWLKEDVARIFTVKRGLKYTEGIVLNLEEKQEELKLEARSFANMTCLRILEISNVQLTGDINYLSNLLGLLNWPGFPSKCLPSNFQSQYLLELHLPRSSIELLWEGKKKFGRLKVIDVSDSVYLLKTPDFSEVPNLERLVLRNCKKLYHIHPSINNLERLVSLNLNGCSSHESFSSNLGCKNLEILTLSMSGLTSFPEIEGNMERLTELYLEGTLLKQLHSSIECLVGLVLLNLRNCVGLSGLPSEIGNLRSLKFLDLNGCTNLDQIPPSLENVESLEYLDIGNTSITHAPHAIHHLKKLRTLNCERLSRNIWKSLFDLSSDSEIFGLGSLESLVLSHCNMEDEDIPIDLCCFSSLQYLDLSGNHFVQLSPSINHLGNLKGLRLDDCFKLQLTPRPTKNLVAIASAKETGTIVRNFPIPNEHRKHVGLELKPIPGLRLNLKAYKEFISEGRMFCYTGDNTEIFKCFDELNEGNCVEIPYDRESFVKNDICGVVLSVCVLCSQNNTDDAFISFYGKFFVHLEADTNPSHRRIPWLSYLTSSTRILILYLPFLDLPNMLSTQNSSSCFKATVWCLMPSVKVQKCGAFVLTRQNASEFLANMFNKMNSNQVKFHTVITGSNHGSECDCIDPETSTVKEDYGSSNPITTQSVENETYSFLLLKTNLKSILWRTYEEGKNHARGYFFPQGEVSVSGWFRIQQPKDTVAMKLPLNLYKDKKWLGLAVFAVFSFQEISEFIDKYSFSFQIGYGDSMCLGNIASHPFTLCWIPLGLLQFSAQVLVLIFQPRHRFPNRLNKSDHLYMNFFTDTARLRVELCGARLVYHQNVEGFIDTIMDCVLKSGEEFYKDYIHVIMGDLLKTYRRPIVNIHRSLEVVVPKDPPTASTFSDSGHLSVHKLLHESFPQPLFMMSIQDRYKSKFNVILHVNEIPKIFTCKGIGNEATIMLPERFYIPKEDYGEGFLVCALVKVDRIPKPQTSVEVLDLICEFGVDSCQVEPEHHHLVAEEKLVIEHPTRFLWLFYIPVVTFDIFWCCYKNFKCKVSTNNEELFCVQQCGLHIVGERDREKVDNLLISLLPHQSMA